jgi:epsilon-lactone hydrolase
VPASGREAILFVHGGGFVNGGGSTYVGFASWVAAATGADVYLPDYRLAPEHPYPAPLDDLFAAYSAVLELGHEPARTAIVGDSAGGALAIGTALTLPEMDVASPAAVVLFSPMLDLSLSGASIAANARRDPMISRAMIDDGGRAHAGGLRRSDPRVSPLFAELRALPPILIQVGSEEILLDDSIRFADRAWAAGVEVELQRFEGMWHDFQGLAATLHVAREALDDVAAFLKRRWAVHEGVQSPPD